jgi:hypothetical protein
MAFNFFSAYKTLNQGGVITSAVVKGIKKANERKRASAIKKMKTANRYSANAQAFKNRDIE